MIHLKNKVSVLFLLLGAMLVQCHTPKAIQKIEYSSLTRGFQKHVVISNDSIVTTISGREQQVSRRALTPEEWTLLQKSLKGVKLTEIPALPSPSKAREYDGARHSTLTVFTRDGKTVAHSFDNEDAHAKLIPLMSAVSTIEQKPNAAN